MQYITLYNSPLGSILLGADVEGLTGLWFVREKYIPENLVPKCREDKLPVFKDTQRWLDIYFTGREPDFMPPIHLTGTPFQRSVWNILQQIPYGKTITYGEIAVLLAKEKGLAKMSAQAIGGAVGHNKISIIIPCHRVVGSNGSLTGYAGGIDKKISLLKIEHVDMDSFFIPPKKTSL